MFCEYIRKGSKNYVANLKHLKIFEEFLVTQTELSKNISKMIDGLVSKKKVLLLTTSNRWAGDNETPKSSLVAEYIKSKLPNATLIDVSKLHIHMCEGNVSRLNGNNCGVKEAVLKDDTKNPTGLHRCWASINNPDDELWKVSRELFESDAVIFFVSVRWGQTNAVYQKLIERLDWLENRHTTLNEPSVIDKISSGMVLIGQNWNGSNVLNVQKQVLTFYGFDTRDEKLFWNWQFTNDIFDESQDSYKQAGFDFKKDIQQI